MTWRAAFLLQARSDHALFDRLSQLEVEPCHLLHYFQMVTEKLAKAWLTKPNATVAPAPVHKAFVRMLQVIKSQPQVRRQLGYKHDASFKCFIDSLLDLASRIENLAPAGLSQPNPEYPWHDRATDEIRVPATSSFHDFERATNPQMARLDKLVRALLGIAR